LGKIQDDRGKKAIRPKKKQHCFDLLHPDRPFMQDATLTQDLAGNQGACFAWECEHSILP